MSFTLGAPLDGPDPNPIGCRVVLVGPDGWVAYYARRDDDHFRFGALLQQGRDRDQGFHGTPNARIIGGGRLVLRN